MTLEMQENTTNIEILSSYFNNKLTCNIDFTAKHGVGGAIHSFPSSKVFSINFL